MNPDGWTPPPLCVEAVQQTDEDTASALSERLRNSGQLQIVAARAIEGGRFAGSAMPWRLLVDGERRTVVRADGARSGPDFIDAGTRRRTAATGPGSEPLLRALGIARLSRRLGRLPALVDTTAGYGMDSWLAASVGCRVHMLERSALVFELLTQALTQACDLPATSDTAARMTLSLTDATDWLQQAPAPAADVIYLDPMFPARRKSAKVGKGMQFLHELLPDTTRMGTAGNDTPALLRAALGKAACRVVVKRPRGAPRLDHASRSDNEAWAGQVTTTESPGLRYDVYHLTTDS